MADVELDKVNRLAVYLDWVLAEIRRDTDSKLAGTRAGELLGIAAATTHELLTLLDLSARALGTDQPIDDSSTRH
jgi:hypothetical protein